MGTGQDLFHLLPYFLRDYWYIIVLFMVLSTLLYFMTPNQHQQMGRQGKRFSYWSIHTVFFVIGILLCGILIRGGFGSAPIDIPQATRHVSPHNVPVVLNTPFSVLWTLDDRELKEKNYLPEEEARKYFDPVHQYQGKARYPGRPNVVMIILESFSQAYIGALSGEKSHAPFLDSLIQESLVFPNAYANGKESIEAIPAITAGLPSLMTSPYITSPYAGNDLNSLASCLGRWGYTTSFYHGGYQGTMGFESFCRKAGFGTYHDLNDYPHPGHSDGSWGIRDGQYLPYFARQLNKTREPFFSTVLTLSSHHPFWIPSAFTKRFPQGSLPIHRTIRYTDHALERFFEKARKADWYDNTLFVITADHTSIADQTQYNNSVGMYRIPLLFFAPSHTLPSNHRKRVAQQTDLMPSLLDLLGYPHPFVAFGQSLFRSIPVPRYHFAFRNQLYQLTGKQYILQFDGTESQALFNHQEDPYLRSNLIRQPSPVKPGMETFLKAVLQQYHNRIREDRLTVP